MVSSTDGWAVGTAGTIMRWDGTSWSSVESPINVPLYSVDMVSSTEGWVVGADGTIYRWQEEAADVPIIYIIIIGAVVVVVIVWFFLRRRSLKKKSL